MEDLVDGGKVDIKLAAYADSMDIYQGLSRSKARLLLVVSQIYKMIEATTERLVEVVIRSCQALTRISMHRKGAPGTTHYDFEDIEERTLHHVSLHSTHSTRELMFCWPAWKS